MKKLFTLALALLVATVGFSQVQKKTMPKYDIRKDMTAIQQAPRTQGSIEYAESTPTMTSTRDIVYGEMDYTYYDWQTNHAAINRTIVWPDGKVNFAFTYAGTSNFSDRGTAIGTYDINTDEWTPSDGRVENEKTGFGSIARYKENGIVVAAHTASDTKVYIIDDKDNMTPNSVPAVLNIGTDIYTHPCVMTSGPNRDIIHMVCSEFDDGDPDGNGIEHGIRYYRSTDGESWDITCLELPYLTIDYGTEHGGNCYYWMETTEDNVLSLVINTGNTDGIVLYSTDNGDSWERKIYFHDPCPGVEDLEESFFYPRWTSALWNDNMELMMAYEINGSAHSGTYNKVGGGCAFWSEYLPYRGTTVEWGFDPNNPMPPTPGQPFIMDSAYLFEDIYSAWCFWSEPTHDMLPEYFGYFFNVDEDGNWEDPFAEEWETDFHFIEGGSLEPIGNHGSYNAGSAMQPVLCKVNGNDNELVTVWCFLDDENSLNDMFYFKLFAAYSCDGGLNWSHPVNLVAGEFEFTYNEMVYPQAAVIGNTLIVAAQVDSDPGTSVISSSEDGNPDDNAWLGFTFDITDLFSWYDGMPEVGSNHNVHMDIYPNPAVDRLNVTLSQNAEIVIYNIMGQKVMSQEGFAGANSININNLTSGVYFVNAGSDTQKFIVK